MKLLQLRLKSWEYRVVVLVWELGTIFYPSTTPIIIFPLSVFNTDGVFTISLKARDVGMKVPRGGNLASLYWHIVAVGYDVISVPLRKLKSDFCGRRNTSTLRVFFRVSGRLKTDPVPTYI